MPANAQNPYTRPPYALHGEAPNPIMPRWGGPGKYTSPDVPESTDPLYVDGFSPEITVAGSPDGTKLHDDIRTGRREPPPNDPNILMVTLRRYSNYLRRASIETHRDPQQSVTQERIPKPTRPIWDQDRLAVRTLASTNPSSYQVTRPWHIPRNIADEIGPGAEVRHSLADHTRMTEIMGMRPHGGIGNNIYRPMPQPWDTNMFIPPQAENQPGGSANAGLWGTQKWH